VSLVLLAVLLGVWHLATLPKQQASAANDEYAEADGKDTKKTQGLPTPAQVSETAWKHLADPFYDRGSNDKVSHPARVFAHPRRLGLCARDPVRGAARVPDRHVPLMHRALDPFIQVLKPISPLAWMPLALYTIRTRRSPACS